MVAQTTETRRVRYYGCCECQAHHYDGEPLFDLHMHYQSKNGFDYAPPLTDEQRQQRDLRIIQYSQAMARQYKSLLADLRAELAKGEQR